MAQVSMRAEEVPTLDLDGDRDWEWPGTEWLIGSSRGIREYTINKIETIIMIIIIIIRVSNKQYWGISCWATIRHR